MSRKIIEKKILPEYFEAAIEDKKHFEIRKDEDDAQAGDAIILKEYDVSERKWIGRDSM